MMIMMIIIIVMVILIMKFVRVNGIMAYTGCFCITFFILFWRVRKTAKFDCWLRHVQLSVRMEQHCSNWTGFRENFIFEYFSKICVEKWSFIKI